MKVAPSRAAAFLHKEGRRLADSIDGMTGLTPDQRFALRLLAIRMFEQRDALLVEAPPCQVLTFPRRDQVDSSGCGPSGSAA